MSDKTQALSQPLAFERPSQPALYKFYFPSLLMTVSLLVVSYFAWLIARTDIPLKGTLEFLFWLSFFLPALPQTMGWILLLDPKYGIFNQALHAIGIAHPVFNIYSFWGIVWA